ncbi:MAG TPA: sigma-70 family RNA polymerase sigma factor [Ktedonobacteraceae bacterium]|nr:sigma-70 family RNA polymerase sigma factor [Ktedonobacteraceae bacterium]
MQIQEANRASYAESPDGVLAQQALSGDQWAFETLVHRYSTSLFNFICHLLGDYDLACDVLQQVFLQLFVSLSTLHKDKPLKSWLFQVARNRCLDELRRKRVVHFSELEIGSDDDEPALAALPDNGPLPEEQVEHRDLQCLLQRAIQALPPRFRAVVILRYTAQLSFSEIGHSLGMPEATAKTYFQRAKPLLRAALATQIQASTTHR